MWLINTLGVCEHSDAHMLLFPSSSKDGPSADGEVVVGSFFRKLHASTSVAFHLLHLCVILLKKIVTVLMERSETP